MAAIASVTSIVASVPLSKATRISTRSLTHREYLIVTVTDVNGSSGHGYTYAGTNGGTTLKDAVDTIFTPRMLGVDGDLIAATWEKLFQETLLVGRRGAAIRALSACDIALWDLKAKSLHTPLAVLLGGNTDPVDAYASGGYYRPDEGAWSTAIAREVRENIEAGFVDHKIKVGGLSIAEDARRIEAAIAAMDGHGRLALDANNAYRSVPEALAALRTFESATNGYGLWWFEEPLSPENIQGHADLRQKSVTAIASGEIHQTRWDFTEIFRAHAVDYIQADAGVIGGITEWIRVAHMAESLNIGIAPHWHANLHAALSPAIPGCFAIEHFLLEKDIYNFERLVTPESRLHFEDGRLHLSSRPGIGFDFDWETVRNYAIA